MMELKLSYVTDVNHDSKKREERMSDHSPLIMEYSF